MNGNSMKVHYNNGETEVFKVEFEAYDLESVVVPMINALVFNHEGKQICLFLNDVKKLEFNVEDEE